MIDSNRDPESGAVGLPEEAAETARRVRALAPIEDGGGAESRASVTRMDMHCHSWASRKPALPVLGLVEMPECYSPPEKVYDQAVARGMDLVTITDHDTIEGGLELVERGFQNFVLGEEVTVRFPEDRCALHVLVWGLTPAQHEELDALGLRDDVYRFAHWLHEGQLAHSFAHPMYVQNGKLKRWHLERASLLFKGWEILNGAHAGTHRATVEHWLRHLTPGKVQALAREHHLRPMWSRIWHKAVTGGSDDHGRMNIGHTWTGVRGPEGKKIEDPALFLRKVMSGHGTVGGQAGHSSLLAHQLTTVGINYYSERMHKRMTARGRLLASKLTPFAGVKTPGPSRVSLYASELVRRTFKRKKKSLPVIDALRKEIGPVLERYPDLRSRLDPATWDDGAAVSSHERMAEFTNELLEALGKSMSGGAIQAMRKRDKAGMVDHLMSYLIVHAAQLPYLFSMFYQNKERNMLERIEHDVTEPGSGVSVLERPMRVCLFTDTLGDVNGVCRFIQNVALQANRTGRDLQVVTSTGFPVPDWSNVNNFEPVFATKMPKYEQLEAVLPPVMKILRFVDQHQPDVIHISTPGPVGLVGFVAARMLRIPVLGVYHTDFPAYIDRLFDDHALTYVAQAYMRFFYTPFHAIFTRSQQYIEALAGLGLQRENIVRLMPGLETEHFNTSYKDGAVWSDLEREGHKGLSGEGLKVLYVGRVSVEKNTPLLETVWKRVHERCKQAGIKADLVVVGDGPYRKTMEERLAGKNAHFLGFRHGKELSTIYASADAFVFPSTTDTLGQVVMESQSSGLPVLVSDKGGPREVVREGETGYVLSADDVSGWVERLFGLLSDDGLRERMSVAASSAMKGYDIALSFEHFWEVHREAWHDHLTTLGITAKTAGSQTMRYNGAGVVPGPGAGGSAAEAV